MEERYNHILSENGILTSFQIAKKIDEHHLKKMIEEIRSTTKSQKELQKKLKEKIIEDTNKNIFSENIPGILTDKNKLFEENLKLKNYSDFAAKIVDTIKKNEIDSYHMCYIINVIINLLKLNEEDFENFNERFDKFNDENYYDDPEK